MIELEGITKVYRTGSQSLEALRGISLKIGKGEFVSIMGPSGSGKSTLMNIVGCLDTPTAGEYLLDGDEVAGLTFDQLAAVRNRKIGFVFQNFNLLPYATAWENVELPMLFDGKNGKKRRERVTELLNAVGLFDWRDHRPIGAFGRPAAAHRPGPGPGQRPAHPARRRADGQPRLEERRGDHGHPDGPLARAGGRSSWSPTTTTSPPAPSGRSASSTARSCPDRGPASGRFDTAGAGTIMAPSPGSRPGASPVARRDAMKKPWFSAFWRWPASWRRPRPFRSRT